MVYYPSLVAFIIFLIYPCNFSCVCALCFFRVSVEENENRTPETKKHSIIFENVFERHLKLFLQQTKET